MKALRMSVQEYEAQMARREAASKPKPRPSGNRALGRLPKGVMNKSETRYADYLDAQKLLGEVLWWKFEGIKLMLAKNTSITIDFAVMLRDGTLVMRDVKAYWEDDARAKMKIAAAMYPLQFEAVMVNKSPPDQWKIEIF